ncbi:MAG: PhnD/SsuA/transferrin family substrate-binding protein [Pseudomonadota bacterium]
MIAALQMYDWPEVRPATDAFWAATAAHLHDDGIDAPAALSRFDVVAEGWRDPKLLIGQTCGLPFIRGRCGSAVPFACGDYQIDGADGGTYSSALVARLDAPDQLSEFRDTTAAINDPGSQSGHNALADAVVQLGGDAQYFQTSLISGSHRQSATLVADGKADIAAIDAVAWDLFRHTEPRRYDSLKVIGWTRPMPALPFITGLAQTDLVDQLCAALTKAAAEIRGPGLPRSISQAEAETYLPIRDMDAALSGYELAARSSQL